MTKKNIFYGGLVLFAGGAAAAFVITAGDKKDSPSHEKNKRNALIALALGLTGAILIVATNEIKITKVRHVAK